MQIIKSITGDVPASEAHRELCYVAHPFGGRRINLPLAGLWVSELNLIFPRLLFWAPWIDICRHWDNNGDSLAHGMVLDLSAVRMSRALIAVNCSESEGARREFAEASAHGLRTAQIDCPSPYALRLNVPLIDYVRNALLPNG